MVNWNELIRLDELKIVPKKNCSLLKVRNPVELRSKCLSFNGYMSCEGRNIRGVCSNKEI